MRIIQIVVDFLAPRFHGLDAHGQPDWPPQPPRLAQALMAGCHLPTEDPEAVAALRALTALPNPVIRAPRARPARLPDTYTHRTGGPLESKEISPKGLGDYLDTTLAGLSASNRVPKPTSYMALEGCRLVYEVEDPEGTVDVAALDRAARRVPYLGRSQDVCDMSVRAVDPVPDGVAHLVPDGAPAVDLDLTPVCWLPRADPTGPHRGWASNLCTWMDLNHEATVSGGQLPAPPRDAYLVRLRYREAATRSETEAPGADASHLAIIPLERPVAAHAIPRTFQRLGVPGLVAEAVGRAAPSVETPCGASRGAEPPQTSGEPPQTSALAAFPAVFAGHDRADGRLYGIGLLASDAAVLARAAGRVSAARGPLDEERLRPLRTLEARTWRRPSTAWVSATPLRAFPDVRVASYVIGQEVLRVTGRAPTIEWSRKPDEPWQSRWRQPPDGLDLWWAHLTFDEPVEGPLLLGASTDLGFGLFVRDPALRAPRDATPGAAAALADATPRPATSPPGG